MPQPAFVPTLHATSLIVIPARMASTRLPRKMLLRDTGKTLIQHTYEAACRARRPVGVCVATDHEEIYAEVQRFGGQVVMTDPALPSGTDRVAEVARRHPEIDLFVNVQGDEPELAGEAIDRAVALLEQNADAVMATLATPIRTREKLADPACVKVVFDGGGRALYFSRSPIPFNRSGQAAPQWRHLGLYVYRREFLLALARLPRTPLEQAEALEQLRALEHGFRIRTVETTADTIGVDTPEDLERVRRLVEAGART